MKNIPDKNNKEVQRFVKSKDMFFEIMTDLHDLNSYDNVSIMLLLYIAAASRKTDNPLSVLFIVPVESGRFCPVETVKRLLPENDVAKICSFNDQSLYYTDGLVDKFLDLGEIANNEVLEHQLTEIAHAKKLKWLFSVKNNKTGKLETKTKTVKLHVSTVMTTAYTDVSPKLAERCFVIDTTKFESKKRSENQLQNQYLKDEKQIAKIITKHVIYQNMLKKLHVVNSFASVIRKPKEVTLFTEREYHNKFLQLMNTVCFLRQFQKEVKFKDGRAFIECDSKDYEFTESLMRQLTNGGKNEI